MNEDCEVDLSKACRFPRSHHLLCARPLWSLCSNLFPFFHAFCLDKELSNKSAGLTLWVVSFWCCYVLLEGTAYTRPSFHFLIKACHQVTKSLQRDKYEKNDGSHRRCSRYPMIRFHHNILSIAAGYLPLLNLANTLLAILKILLITTTVLRLSEINLEDSELIGRFLSSFSKLTDQLFGKSCKQCRSRAI